MVFRVYGSKPLAALSTNPDVSNDANGKVRMDLKLIFESIEDAKAFLVKNSLPTVVFDSSVRPNYPR